jgi:hypothetical protein
MPKGKRVVLACDESGAKGYADQDEAWSGEVGVFAGILIPQLEREAQSRPEFQSIYERYKPATGKLHIADLGREQQEALRQDVYAAIRRQGLPCFWYAIHVAGLYDYYEIQTKVLDDARREAEAIRSAPRRVQQGSPREVADSMHVQLFEGLYANLVAFLSERDCTETDVEIRTDRIDSPIVKEFEQVAKRLLNQDPSVAKVTG